MAVMGLMAVVACKLLPPALPVAQWQPPFSAASGQQLEAQCQHFILIRPWRLWSSQVVVVCLRPLCRRLCRRLCCRLFCSLSVCLRRRRRLSRRERAQRQLQEHQRRMHSRARSSPQAPHALGLLRRLLGRWLRWRLRLCLSRRLRRRLLAMS